MRNPSAKSILDRENSKCKSRKTGVHMSDKNRTNKKVIVAGTQWEVDSHRRWGQGSRVFGKGYAGLRDHVKTIVLSLRGFVSLVDLSICGMTWYFKTSHLVSELRIYYGENGGRKERRYNQGDRLGGYCSNLGKRWLCLGLEWWPCIAWKIQKKLIEKKFVIERYSIQFHGCSIEKWFRVWAVKSSRAVA